MAPPSSKSKYWLIVLGFLSGAVILVIILLGYLFLSLPPPAATASPTSRGPALALPTAPIPTATPGPPPAPLEAVFIAKEPVIGFSNCEMYGFRGRVLDSSGQGIEGTQVVVWEEEGGLFALATTDDRGIYLIQLKGKPAPGKRWVQVYKNDRPASAPLMLETQIDCQSGFQIYQVDWREVNP